MASVLIVTRFTRAELRLKDETAAIISRHGGHPRASRGAEAGNCRNSEAQFSLLANAQTGLYAITSDAQIEGNHGRIEVHD